jgi:hypothetical protein
MLQKLAISGIAAAILLIPTGAIAQFYGPGRWCAVINTGTGHVTWDCTYNSVEQCRPNVIAGNRGFCNLNPSIPIAGPYAWADGPACRTIIGRGWHNGRRLTAHCG